MLLLAALVIAAADMTATSGLPGREPAAVGMSSARLSTIHRVVQRGIDAGGYPGASVVVGRKGYSVLSRGFGALDWSGRTRVTSQESIYDLASLTKVVATTTAIMVLYDAGKVDIDAPVSRYLPDFSGGLRDQVTVRHLLTHRAGLPAGRELWRIAKTPAEARAAVLASPIQCAPGHCYEYSDLGADLLGFVAEAASGQTLDAFLERSVFAKLGMTDTHFRPDPMSSVRIAPTEIVPPRGYPLRGEVHDENAYALGGVAGHAGLFSTAEDLSVFAQMLLDGGVYNGVRVVSDSAVALFTTRAAGHRAVGWDTCDGGAGCGQYMSERAFGHTGFTGTSLWIDPDRDLYVVCLTNRVHPEGDVAGIKALRVAVDRSRPTDVRHFAHQPGARRARAPSQQGDRRRAERPRGCGGAGGDGRPQWGHGDAGQLPRRRGAGLEPSAPVEPGWQCHLASPCRGRQTRRR